MVLTKDLQQPKEQFLAMGRSEIALEFWTKKIYKSDHFTPTINVIEKN